MSQIQFGSDNSPGTIDIVTITGNTGGAVPPNGAGNINILGSGSVNIAGNPGTNTLTVTVSGSGLTWTDQSGAFSAAASNGYFITNTATATLPGSPTQGDTIEFILDTASILTIQANTGQFIRIGNTVSAAAGTAVSTLRGDSVTLVYRSSSISWIADSVTGLWGVT